MQQNRLLTLCIAELCKLNRKESAICPWLSASWRLYIRDEGIKLNISTCREAECSRSDIFQEPTWYR